MSENIIRWMVKDHLIFTKVYNWDIAGVQDHAAKINSMINQSDKLLVHSIWDFRDMEKFPTNLNEIRKANDPLFTNKRLGWAITILDNKMVGFLAQAIASMYGVRYRTVGSLDEAKRFMQQQDSTLPDLTEL